MKWVYFFKKFYQNKSLLYSCIIKFFEKFHNTKLHYRRSDLDVLMSAKFNYLNSQTKSIDHGFIVIFFFL